MCVPSFWSLFSNVFKRPKRPGFCGRHWFPKNYEFCNTHRIGNIVRHVWFCDRVAKRMSLVQSCASRLWLMTSNLHWINSVQCSLASSTHSRTGGSDSIILRNAGMVWPIVLSLRRLLAAIMASCAQFRLNEIVHKTHTNCMLIEWPSSAAAAAAWPRSTKTKFSK